MGQKKGIVYNLIVITFFILIWYLTTSHNGYSPQTLSGPLKSYSPFNFLPLEVNLIIASQEDFQIPSGIIESLSEITKTFSRLFDLTVTFHTITTSSPKKIKSSSLNTIKSQNLIIFFSNSFEKFNEDNIYLLAPSEIESILSIFIGYLRSHAKLPNASTGLINGLTEGEHQNIGKFKNDWLLYALHLEIETYNRMIEINSPIISEKLYGRIEDLKEELDGLTEDQGKAYGLWRQIKRLNEDVELGVRSYFKWDFKVGVYAPIFFPVVFPMSAAMYSRLFLRK